MKIVRTVSTYVPWWAKIGLKLAISRIPLKHTFWEPFAIFKLGLMREPDYALFAFRQAVRLGSFPCPAGFTMLELGPGDSVSSGLVSRAYGAVQSYLVDCGDFATGDVAVYRRMTDHLRKQGLPATDLRLARTRDDVCRAAGIAYLTDGVESLRLVPTASVDFVFSQAVLGDIRRREFLPTIKELRRVMKPDGYCVHRVDLKDHLGGSLNNLRFSSKTWESEWMASSGFYTNRIRYAEMLRLFRETGFESEVVEEVRWPRLPTPRTVFSPEFRDLPEEDLLVEDFSVVLRPLAAQASKTA